MFLLKVLFHFLKPLVTVTMVSPSFSPFTIVGRSTSLDLVNLFVLSFFSSLLVLVTIATYLTI